AIDVGIVKMLFVDSTPTAPPVPSGLSATPGNAQVALSWSPSSGATGYNLKRLTNSGSGFTTIAANLSETNYTDLTVSNGVNYYYVVSATNSVGESSNSAQISATPVAPSSSLVAWFKADAITGVSGGAGLATWTDFSGNGNHATQSTAG